MRAENFIMKAEECGTERGGRKDDLGGHCTMAAICPTAAAKRQCWQCPDSSAASDTS